MRRRPACRGPRRAEPTLLRDPSNCHNALNNIMTRTSTGNSQAAAAQRGPPGVFQYPATVANSTLAASQASQRSNRTLRGRVEDTNDLYGYGGLVLTTLLYATRYGFDAIVRWSKRATSSQPKQVAAMEYITLYRGEEMERSWTADQATL